MLPILFTCMKHFKNLYLMPFHVLAGYRVTTQGPIKPSPSLIVTCLVADMGPEPEHRLQAGKEVRNRTIRSFTTPVSQGVRLGHWYFLKSSPGLKTPALDPGDRPSLHN